MSKDAKQSLGVPGANNASPSKRKMTQAIIEDQEKEKEGYEFLEEDDDFEEFEQDYEGIDLGAGVDVEMATGDVHDRKLWQ